MADIAMTGEAGANRTFRSIFGDQERPNDKLSGGSEHSSRTTSGPAASAPAAPTAMEEDDDDESMWSDEPPLNGGASGGDNNDMPLASPLQFAQRKSMEEWAEDDDEEENWKEALQDRVNQLELAFQHNDESTAAESRQKLEQHQRHLPSQHQETQRVDFIRSLASKAASVQQTNRHKMQRTSSTHACITGENAGQSSSSRPKQLWNFQRKVITGGTKNTLSQDQRTRSTSTDFVARNIQTAEHHRKRSGSMSSTSSRTDSPRSSLSRKDSQEGNRNRLGRTNSSNALGAKTTHVHNTSSRSSGPASATTAVFNLSDTEAIRRYVLDDIKHISMERLVNDAHRLHFLEDFYQSQQGPRHTPSVTSSTAVAPPLSPSSSSAMSTS